MKKIILLFFLFIVNACLSQGLRNTINDSLVFDHTKHKRIYEFTIGGSPPFFVSITEFLNGKVKGTIGLNLYKDTEDDSEKFKAGIPIRRSKVREIFNLLDNMQFEGFQAPYDPDNCAFVIHGHDTYFEIQSDTVNKKLSFYGVGFKGKEYQCDCDENNKAQRVVNLLDQTLDFGWQFQEIRNLLPSGGYWFPEPAGYAVLKVD